MPYTMSTSEPETAEHPLSKERDFKSQPTNQAQQQIEDQENEQHNRR